MNKICVFVVSALLFSSACSTPTVNQVLAKDPIDILHSEEAKPILFKKVVVKLKRGQEIGRLQGGLMCIDRGPLTWKGGKVNLTGDEFTEVFREELEKANYPVVGNPDALFEDPDEWKAELLVAGLVKDMQANMCYPRIYYYDYETCRGSAYIGVNWQVYSRLDRKVVYETNTEGSSSITQASATVQTDLFLNAFSMATQNLLSDEGFHNLVVKSKHKPDKSVFDTINIEAVDKFEEPIANHISSNRLSVVTIFAGDGHGSGFFISSDGYILTNAHVVGGARFATIKLTTGRELVAEVIRKNSIRDVALLNIEESKMIPLPIRTTSVNVGDEVYALGSPLDEEMSTTLSKGIVSGFRVVDDQSFIQSDVNILPGNSGGPLMDKNGNAVGISTLIFVGRANIMPSGLNFFIPISEALESVNVKLADLRRDVEL